MKYLKYTLLLIILLTFVSVRAETCTYEEKQKLAENVDLSKLKLTYVKEEDEDSEGYIKAEMDLDDNNYAVLIRDGSNQVMSNRFAAYAIGGKNKLIINNKECGDIIYESEIFLPYYNSKNKNIFDDGSNVAKTNTKMILIIVATVLLAINIVLIRRSIKYEIIS